MPQQQTKTDRFRRPFQFEVLTPESRLCTADAVSVVFPAWDGLVGVLGGHGPMVALIGAGPLIVRDLDGQVQEFYVAGGFAHVREGLMALLAEECVRLEDVDREAAWQEIQRARALPTETDEEIARRQEKIVMAQAKFSVAQRYFRRTQMPPPAEGNRVD